LNFAWGILGPCLVAAVEREVQANSPQPRQHCGSDSRDRHQIMVEGVLSGTTT
jgi:hypothetical protein